MLTPRFVNVYGYVFLGIVLIMLVLIWFKVVPQSMYIPLFMVAVVLYLVRITLRLVLERQRRLEQKDGTPGGVPHGEGREQ